MGIKQFHLVCTFIIWCLFSGFRKHIIEGGKTYHVQSLVVGVTLLEEGALSQPQQEGRVIIVTYSAWLITELIDTCAL